MSARRSRLPQVESLEPLVLLSSGSARVQHAPKGAAAAEAAPAATLAGTADGTFFAHKGSPESGPLYNIFASGKVAPGGPGLLVGGIQSRGFTATGAGGGNLVIAFKSGPGNLFLHLTETANPGPGQFQFTYKATNGSQSGTLTLTLHPINTNIHGQPVSNPGFFGNANLTFQPGT
jgi:hypothetical protein